jgi:hypothetical protein
MGLFRNGGTRDHNHNPGTRVTGRVRGTVTGRGASRTDSGSTVRVTGEAIGQLRQQ